MRPSLLLTACSLVSCVFSLQGEGGGQRGARNRRGGHSLLSWSWPWQKSPFLPGPQFYHLFRKQQQQQEYWAPLAILSMECMSTAQAWASRATGWEQGYGPGPEDQYEPTRGWELLICGSYPASVFYLAHSISQVLISSLFYIKSGLLVSLEKSDSVAPLSLHSPQPASVQVSPLPPTHALWTGRPCPSVSASCTLPNCAKSLRFHPCRGSASRAVLCERVCLRSQHPFAVRGVGSNKPILLVDKQSYHPHAWLLVLGLTGRGDMGMQGLESFS